MGRTLPWHIYDTTVFQTGVEKSQGRYRLGLTKWPLFCRQPFQICTFLKENVWISIKISMKFFPKGNIPALVQIMASSLQGDTPLS